MERHGLDRRILTGVEPNNGNGYATTNGDESESQS
jgi:hypothetical protein